MFAYCGLVVEFQPHIAAKIHFFAPLPTSTKSRQVPGAGARLPARFRVLLKEMDLTVDGCEVQTFRAEFRKPKRNDFRFPNANADKV